MSVSFNHDGKKIVSGSSDDTIRVWNAETGESELTLEGDEYYFNSVSFNHNGTKIVSGSEDGTVRVWNVETGESELTLEGHTDHVWSVSFNHDGKKIVSGSNDKTVRVWNAETGESELTLEGHTGGVSSVSFNHDGTKIVSGSWDKGIKIWNAETGESELTLEGHTGGVSSVSFNHNGAKIVFGSTDKTVRVRVLNKYPFMINISDYEKYMKIEDKGNNLVVNIVIEGYSLIINVYTDTTGKYRVEKVVGDNILKNSIGLELYKKIKNQEHKNIKELIEDIYTEQIFIERLKRECDERIHNLTIAYEKKLEEFKKRDEKKF